MAARPAGVTWLYRAYDGSGVLLYAGITCNPRERMYDHKCSSLWFEHVASFTWHRFGSRVEAAVAEANVYATEGPLHGSIGGRDMALAFPRVAA